MTQTNKRKQAKNTSHHASNPSPPAKKSSAMRIFMMYFVVFGTILAFIGLMGDDGLPGSGLFLWLLVAINFVISTIATFSHMKSGRESKIDEMSEKW
jgi:heme/copper-type cytochrome/quinol oxidase subunit 4